MRYKKIGRTTFSRTAFPILESILILSKILNGIDNLTNLLNTHKYSADNPFSSSKLSRLEHFLPLINFDATFSFLDDINRNANTNYILDYGNYQIQYTYGGDTYEGIKSENIICNRTNLPDTNKDGIIERINLMPFYVSACERALELGLT